MVGRQKSKRIMVQIGATVAVAAAVPMTDLSQNLGSGPERLSALRAAAAAELIELVATSSDGSPQNGKSRLAQGGGSFDKSITFDKQP
jgi:hypothetical protein